MPESGTSTYDSKRSLDPNGDCRLRFRAGFTCACVMFLMLVLYSIVFSFSQAQELKSQKGGGTESVMMRLTG